MTTTWSSSRPAAAGSTSLFAVDADAVAVHAPQRVAALTYLRGVTPDPAGPGLRYHSRRGRRRVLHLPGADRRRARATSSSSRACPAGRSTAWDDVATPAEHLAGCAQLLAEHFPAEAARLADATLVDDRSVLRGRITPVVRRPVGTLPERRAGARDGRRRGAQRPADQPGLEQRDQVGVVLPRGDHRARGRVRRGLDAAHLRQLLARLGAVGHRVDELLAAAGRRRTSARSSTPRRRHPSIAEQIAAGFDDARLFSPWWFDADDGRGVRRVGRSAPRRRASTPATCAGPWASTPPASRS